MTDKSSQADAGIPRVFLNIPYYKKEAEGWWRRKNDLFGRYLPVEAAIKAALLFVGIRPVLAREIVETSPRLHERIIALMDSCIGAITDIRYLALQRGKHRRDG